MSFYSRLEGQHQTTAILVEADYVAVQVFYGDPGEEDPEQPDAAMLYDADELQRLTAALFQARIDLLDESWREYCRVMADGFSCDAPLTDNDTQAEARGQGTIERDTK